MIATWPTPANWAAWITCKASDVETSLVGPFSAGPIVTTTLPAFPIALAIDSALLKLDSTALRRFDSSLDKICGYDAKANNTKDIIVKNCDITKRKILSFIIS